MPPSSSSIALQHDAPVSAIVTAFDRREKTASTLRKLQQCVPRPAEILVHVDGGNEELAGALRSGFPDVRVLVSGSRIGPGGSRNLLIEAAREELVASFDDDSYPADADYFQRVVDAARERPDAAMIAATIMDPQSAPPPEATSEAANFVGCGCVYRRSIFLRTSGYIPLPVAYGMEEADLSIRLHSMECKIIHDPSLRVVHDLEPAGRETDAVVAAAMVSNVALLAWLRYPVILWPLGVAQVLRKAVEIVIKGESAGVIRGLLGIPRQLWEHRHQRDALKVRAVISHVRMRRRTKPAVPGSRPLHPVQPR